MRDEVKKALDLVEKISDTSLIYNFYQCTNDIKYCDIEYCYEGNYKGLLKHFEYFGFDLSFISDISFYDYEYNLLESEYDIEEKTNIILINYYHCS